MDAQLREVILRLYGARCEKHLEEIDVRIAKMITALLYAGNAGNTPLNELNKAFERV